MFDSDYLPYAFCGNHCFAISGLCQENSFTILWKIKKQENQFLGGKKQQRDQGSSFGKDDAFSGTLETFESCDEIW